MDTTKPVFPSDDDGKKGSAGGRARDESLSDEDKKRIASQAAKTRWEKHRLSAAIRERQKDAPLPEIPTALRSGELPIGGWLIPCHVLANDLRVVSQRFLMEVLEIRARSAPGGERLLGFLRHPVFEISQSFKDIALAIQEPVRFFNLSGTLTFGYTGETVIDYCKVILQARKSGLFEGQAIKRYAMAAESFITAVAKVGIVALIDEATGHQDHRERDELQRHLERYLKKEFAAWAKRFPDEFYMEIFRLRGWQWKGMKINRPQVVGTYTNDVVYSRMAPNLLEELQQINPSNETGLRHHRHHQHLTFDVGHPHLQQHLYAVLAMMRASNSWDALIRMLDRSFPRIGDTFALALDDDELNPPTHRAPTSVLADQPSQGPGQTPVEQPPHPVLPI